MAAEPFAVILDRLEALYNERGLRIVTTSGLREAIQLNGSVDATIPWLVHEGRDLLRRLANGEALDPADAGKAHRTLQGAGE